MNKAKSMTQAELAPFENVRIDHFHNYPSGDGKGDAAVISQEGARAAWNRITAWDGYLPTPLVRLPGLATALGVADVMFKDEGGRFGLGSFKALGGAYAVSCLLAEKVGATPEDLMSGAYRDAVATITVTSATDGNHGRSVAWGARTYGCPCVIYIHAEVSESRAKAMEDLGAQVIRIAGNYDESVRQCSVDAETHGRFVVSDTSYEGYREVPKRVMEGYTVMVTELIEQSAGVLPTLVFVQGGGRWSSRRGARRFPPAVGRRAAALRDCRAGTGGLPLRQRRIRPTAVRRDHRGNPHGRPFLRRGVAAGLGVPG